MDIMVIGDSLTAVEYRNHRMMTGPAADILRNTMVKVGLPIIEPTTHFSVAIKEFVPRKKGTPIPKAVIDKWHPILIAEINRLQPKIIIPLGKAALSVLTGDPNIKVKAEYARPRKYASTGDANIIPVMHPALIIRAPGDYKPFLAEMELIASIYKGAQKYDVGVPRWIVLKTEEECDSAIDLLKSKARIAADIETTGLDYRIAEFCVMGMCFEKNKIFIIPREMRHRCKDFFALQNIRWTWHHGE